MPVADSTYSKQSRVVLLGFMGAGKSTVGPLLAGRLGWVFHDADAVLSKRTGLSIAQLFTQHGEAGFRTLEAETVAGLMHREQVVIALGGGAIESPSTRSLLQSSINTQTVFLNAPLETLLARCRLSSEIRPLLMDLDDIPQRYQRRLPHYQGAGITVDTEGLTQESVVELLMQQLRAHSLKTQAEKPAAEETLKGRSL